MGNGFFPGKRDQGVAMSTHHHLTPRIKEEQSYISTPHLGLPGLFYDELYLHE